jgi:hypothetical protein
VSKLSTHFKKRKRKNMEYRVNEIFMYKIEADNEDDVPALFEEYMNSNDDRLEYIGNLLEIEE